MKILPYIFSSLIAFTIVACGNQKTVVTEEVTETESPKEMAYFIIGEGGGFTGMYEQYKVSETGEVESWNNIENQTTKTVGKLDETVVKDLFKRLRKLKLEENPVNAPGNMNYSINYVDNERAYTVLWSDNNSPSVDVLAFYKEAMNAVRSLKK